MAADSGYIGGDYCHEFVVESEIGETKFLATQDAKYQAHVDVAKFTKYKEVTHEEMKPLQNVEGKGMIGVYELAKYLKIPAEKTTKTLIFETEKHEIIAAAVNGIYDINETKLKNILQCSDLKLASPEIIKKITGAEVGYAGILNLPKSVRVIMDESLANRANFECGANRTNFHSINVNFDRDLAIPDQFYDIALAKENYIAKDGKQNLIEKRGIEVGNIFQLGYHYTSLMKGANFIDNDGKAKPYYMGCYGIGLGRTLAAVVEVNHDEKGICWPKEVAPFDYHLISLPGGEEFAIKVYQELSQKGFDVLWDDRDISAGAKFADADLIGIPVRLVVSQKTGDKVEMKLRKNTTNTLVSLSDLLNLTV